MRRCHSSTERSGDEPSRKGGLAVTKHGVLVLVLVLLGVGSVRGFDVTSCNTLVPANEVAVLQNDMSCNGAFIGVGLGENATLDLNGHSITGTFYPDPPRAVECRGVRCTILSSNGTGRIGGGDFVAVEIGLFTYNRARLTISDVDLHDARAGIQGSAFVLYPRKTQVRAERVRSHGHAEYGIWVQKLTARDVDASDNGGVGASADKLSAVNMTASGNAYSGLFGERISAKGLVANDNGDAGVRAVVASLRNATLTGNDGLGIGADIATVRKPHVQNVTCGKSQILGGVGGQGWGVCAND
jgi:hypothetical protein